MIPRPCASQAGMTSAWIAAVQQVVVHLGRDRPGQVRGAGRPVGVGDLPGREVAVADVADLARADQVVERPERLLDRRRRVRGVDLVEVDVVGPEAAQAVLDRPDDPAARRAPLVRASRSSGMPNLVARTNRSRRPASKRPSWLSERARALRRAAAVDVGRVDEGDALVERPRRGPRGPPRRRAGSRSCSCRARPPRPAGPNRRVASTPRAAPPGWQAYAQARRRERGRAAAGCRGLDVRRRSGEPGSMRNGPARGP